ncbi:MAG: aldo/keto reductase [Nitrospinaceae bacterium]|nr:aldo/keto reductase [Nitrospinaceae bacterium]NIR53719.1 aldo/keto reductase [Nitrospinaceae bacterium]NIS84127.1 aldo/keto reductase [Nitrospinaceae bacterium]NIT80928.1 aldo/keto reductase [Nitrospinaceae bacterium]NIU43226.1 aldo/keto reductase [Nitrospinaceae bacterium]
MRHSTCKGLDKPWSVLTFGCWQIAPSGGWGDYCSPEDAEASVKTALEGGITAFDTAEGYGDGESERRLGKALGSKKNDVLIISKIWPDAELTLASYQKQLEGSLRALARDYVDLYLIHWPGAYFNTPEKSQQLADIMAALQDSGKARTVGLSNFEAADLKRLGDDLSQFAVNQVSYNLLEREYEQEALPLAQQAGIGTMAYSPSARGLLGGRLAVDSPTRRNYEVYQEPLFTRAKTVYQTVREIAEELETAPINVALAWVLAQKHVITAAVGSKKPEQIRQFCQAGDLPLSPEHRARLNTASDAFHRQK